MIIQDDWWQGKDCRVDLGIAFSHDFERSLSPFVRIGPETIESDLVGIGFVEKIDLAGIFLKIEEVILNDSVKGFHIGINVWFASRNTDMLGSIDFLNHIGKERLRLRHPVAAEFSSVNGLDRDLRGRDPVSDQVFKFRANLIPQQDMRCHFLTVGTVVMNFLAVGLMPISLTLSTIFNLQPYGFEDSRRFS
jgi:hypothetical protein